MYSPARLAWRVNISTVIDEHFDHTRILTPPFDRLCLGNLTTPKSIIDI
jgi:hypothetical protein